MTNEDIANAVIDEILSKIDRLKWVKSYEVYFHSLEQNSVENSDANTSFGHLDSSGVALRLLTSTNSMVFTAASLQQVPLLISSLSQPKTSSSMGQIEFQPLKESFIRLPLPEFLGIEEIESWHNLLQSLLPSRINYRFVSRKETRMITNQGSPLLYEQNISNTFEFALRVKPNLNIALYDMIPFLYNEHRFLKNVDKKIKEYLSYPPKIETVHNLETFSVVFGPKIVAKMILEVLKSNTEIQALPSTFQVYENPHAPFHFFSSIYDDEGLHTHPKELITNGTKIPSSFFYEDNVVQLGQNGFRYNEFGEVPRKYDFPPRFHFTNIFVEGGSGTFSNFLKEHRHLMLLEDGDVVCTEGFYHVFVRQGLIYSDGKVEAIVGQFNVTIPTEKLIKHGEYTADRKTSIIMNHFSSVECGFLGIHPHLLSLAF